VQGINSRPDPPPDRPGPAPRDLTASSHEAPVAAAREGTWLAGCCLAAAATLGITLQISDGTLDPTALWGLGATLALCTLGVAASDRGRESARAEQVLALLLGLALLLQLNELWWVRPEHPPRPASLWIHPAFRWALAAEAALAGAVVAVSRRWRRRLLPALLAVHFGLGVWTLHASPAPFIDVFVFQTQGSDALLRGANPYAMTFPNIYRHGFFYGEHVVANGRLLFGFPYPPLSLFLALLARLAAGDPRYAQLTAIVLAAACMAWSRGGRLAAGAAALLLLTPRGFYVLEMAWTEPLLVGLLAATVFCACRFPRALPVMLGLMLCVKQYTVFMVPLIWLLTPLRGRALWRLLVGAATTALVVSLPLALLDPTSFYWSVLELQFHQPFRIDSLSFLAASWSPGHAAPPWWLAFLGAAAAVAFSLWRAPRTPAGFAAATAFVYCVFFALNKQAFANYYYFVVGSLCLAVAVRQRLTAPHAPMAARGRK